MKKPLKADKKTLLTSEEWETYSRSGEQLDTQMARSIMLETLYLTLRCIQIQGNNIITQYSLKEEMDDKEK